MSKNIVITGSTSGIGKELLELLAEEADVKIFAGYRNKDLLVDYGEKVVPFYMDMTDRNSIIQASEFIKSKTDKIDLVFNIAGCVVAGPVELLDMTQLRKQFEVNTFSHLEFSQSLLPVMENSRIINVSSVASFGHFPFISPYCASKRALDILFNAFAIENHKNIKVISIKPGVIGTPLWDKSVKINEAVLKSCGEYQKEMEFMRDNALKNSNRGLKVEEVAKFIKEVAYKNKPKSTYTLGIDSKFGHFLSYLPQDLVNKLIKFGLKMRINKV